MDDIITSDSMLTAVTLHRWLPALCERLRVIHCSKRSDRYFEVLLLPWLSHYLHIVKGYGAPYDLPRSAMEAPETVPVIHGYADLIERLVEGRLDSLLAQENPIAPAQLVPPPERNDEGKGSLASRVLRRALFRVSGGCLVCDNYLDRSTTHMLRRISGGLQWGRLPFFAPSRRLVRTDWRDFRDLGASCDWEIRARNGLTWAFPASLLENFEDYSRWAKHRASRFQAALISNTLYSRPSFLFLFAEIRERGGCLIGNQHGCGYGTLDILSLENIERHLTDFFITWGWSDGHAGSEEGCVPLPVPRLSRLRDTHRQTDNRVLFVETAWPRHVLRLSSFPQPVQMEAFFGGENAFLAALNSSVRDDFLYRPYQEDYGWPQLQTRRRQFPASRTVRESSLLPVLQRVALVVMGYPGTSFLEAMALNTPCVVFWPRGLFPHRPEAQSFLDELEAVGIYHDDPLACARHVKQVRNRVADWWRSNEVQTVRQRFVHQFARTAPDCLAQWRRFAEKECVAVSRSR